AVVGDTHVRHRAAGGVVKIQVKRRGDETLAGAARTAQFGGDGHLLAPVDGHLVEERGARTDVVPPDALAERSGLRESGTARPPSGRSRDRLRGGGVPLPGRVRRTGRLQRSEEHTSELQSRENLVCRLLLE